VAKLDHLAIVVRDWRAACDWYARHLDLRVEFEIPERRTAALQDDAGFTLFVAESDAAVPAPSCVLTFQVEDVAATYDRLTRAGVRFECPPSKRFWGFGAELRDPDGYLVYLWDERSMREKGGS
jgi:catechol 2,3-dioxygenase-like lactoylglutathione lyase family enzyme